MDEHDYGTLQSVGETGVLTFTRHLAHPREKVWRAVTEPEHLAAWFPQSMVGERAAGARLRFETSDGDGFDGESDGFFETCDDVGARRIVHGDDDHIIDAKQGHHRVSPCKALRDEPSEVAIDGDRIDVDKIDVELRAERLPHGRFAHPPEADEHLP